MHFLTLFSLCSAEIYGDALKDAKVTVEFLRKQAQAFGKNPDATRLLYLIFEALRRYHPLATFAAWNRTVEKVVTELKKV
jgi:hypothetical protein